MKGLDNTSNFIQSYVSMPKILKSMVQFKPIVVWTTSIIVYTYICGIILDNARSETKFTKQYNIE